MSTHAQWLERAGDRPRSATTVQDPPAATGAERTAAWRLSLDRKRRPETTTIGMALLMELVRNPAPDRPVCELLHAAIEDLRERGYERAEVHDAIRRLRRRRKRSKRRLTNT